MYNRIHDFFAPATAWVTKEPAVLIPYDKEADRKLGEEFERRYQQAIQSGVNWASHEATDIERMEEFKRHWQQARQQMLGGRLILSCLAPAASPSVAEKN